MFYDLTSIPTRSAKQKWPKKGKKGKWGRIRTRNIGINSKTKVEKLFGQKLPRLMKM